MVWLSQLLSLIRKEFLAIWSDKKSRIIIIVPPLMQLFIFSFAVILEVKNIDIAVLDRDNSAKSQELIRNLTYSESFTNVYRL
jgi:ABC-2 type transport system permease protein